MVACECLKLTMSPFPRGLLEQVGLAEGDLPSQPQHDYGAVNGVLHGASSALPDALGLSEGASWAAHPPSLICGPGVGPGVVHKKNGYEDGLCMIFY